MNGARGLSDIYMVWYGMVWYGMVWYACICGGKMRQQTFTILKRDK